jgi:6-pyruvoyltetrahydropterin/6-carboxytetrahydropterin synthase
VRLTSRYRFAAAHRLDTPALSPEENRKLYGKCNNPFGHGHDYVVDVTVEGPTGADGQVVNRAALDRVVREAVIEQLDHKNLNADVPEFAHAVPTTENLAGVIQARLELAWPLPARLVRLRIGETDRNTFVWERPSPAERQGGSAAK